MPGTNYVLNGGGIYVECEAVMQNTVMPSTNKLKFQWWWNFCINMFLSSDGEHCNASIN